MLIIPETSCACDVCKQMCKHQACFATPDDVKKLIAAGYKEKLEVKLYHDPLLEIDFPVVSGKMVSGACIFQNSEDLCELHDKGLKPKEGRAAHHSLVSPRLSAGVAFSWCLGDGEQVMAMLDNTKDIVEYIRQIKKHMKK